MNPQNSPPLHPVLKVAAGSVIVASAVIVASLTGLMPGSMPEPTTPAVVAAAPSTAPAVPLAPMFESLPAPAAGVVTPAPEPEPMVMAEPKPAPVVKKPRPRVVAYEEPAAPRYEAPVPAPAAAPAPTPAPAPVICYSCGTVQSVNTVTEAGQGSGVGAVTGAVLGGVAGHQMGKGKGKDAMTVVGVIGGALAGNATEKALKKTQYYEVTVRMDDGNVQTFRYESPPPYSSGDAVRVESGQLMRRY